MAGSVPLRRVLAVVALAAGRAGRLRGVVPVGGEPDAGDDRPVVVGDLAARSVVDAAAQDLTEITSTSYQNYDEQVDHATTLMTPEFAAKYRATAASLAPTFADRRREIAAQVVASAVVRATGQEVEALVFLDSQISERGRDPVLLPYRTLVTMTKTDHGWLVSDIETR